jgi:hypothetical protein
LQYRLINAGRRDCRAKSHNDNDGQREKNSPP